MAPAQNTSPRTDPDDQPAQRNFPVNADTRPIRAGDVREYPLGEEEVLLFAQGRQVVHALNASAWAVWDLCDGSRTVREIGRELAEVVGRTPGELGPDILSTVQQLGTLGLLDAV
jgi:Coenzyme PQQ synthesis protein D (PqqD)